MNELNVRQLPQLLMGRPNLNDLPQVEIPPGYSIHSYQPGDEKAWDQIIAASFGRKIDEGQFLRVMKSDTAFQPERIFFLAHGHDLVATASAWFIPKYGKDTGCIHYVGVLPGHQGKRLGYWISLVVLWRLVEEGFQKAVLGTDDFRLPAIKVYLQLGFGPILVHENQRERWKNVLTALDPSRKLETKFADVIAGPVVTVKQK